MIVNKQDDKSGSDDCHQDCQRAVLRFAERKINHEENTDYQKHDMKQNNEIKIRNKKLSQENQWQNHRHGCNGKSVVIMVGALFRLLTLPLQNIEESQANDGAHTVDGNDQKPKETADT